MSNKPEWSNLELFCLTAILTAACVTAVFLYKRGRIRLSQGICGMALLLWLLFVIGSTVLTRVPGKRQMNLTLFWSWKEAAERIMNPELTFKDRYGLLIEILLNMVLLLPAGFLLPLTLNRRVRPVYGLLFGLLVSGAIEAAQLITCRGLFEFDDILGNTIGCMAGCALSSCPTERNAPGTIGR